VIETRHAADCPIWAFARRFFVERFTKRKKPVARTNPRRRAILHGVLTRTRRLPKTVNRKADMRNLTTPNLFGNLSSPPIPKSPSPGSHKHDIRDVKRHAQGQWLSIFIGLSVVGVEYLTTNHGPCPVCGGEERFRLFDDFDETGGAVCNQCGSFADGLAVIEWLTGWPFPVVLDRVADAVQMPTARGGEVQVQAIAPQEKSPLTYEDAIFRHKVYSRLLAACPLTDDAREGLRNRGLTDAEIDHRQYGYVGEGIDIETLQTLAKAVGGGKELARVPGMMIDRKRPEKLYWSINAEHSLLIPVRDVNGRIIAMKKRLDNPASDGGRYRFLSRPKGSPWPSSGSPCHVPLRSVERPIDAESIRLTEGPLKADIATALTGILTIGVGGVGQWKSAIPIIAEYKPKRLLIAFDADCASNPAVAQAVIGAYREIGGGAQ
jgi:hypothetical protein